MVSDSVKLKVKLWYRNKPLRINTLEKYISKSAGLAREYISHCIRSTTVTLLNHSGFEPRYIATCTVSGHRHKSFLSIYLFHTSGIIELLLKLRVIFAYITVLSISCLICTLCLNISYVECLKCMYITGWSCGNPSQCCIRCVQIICIKNSDLYYKEAAHEVTSYSGVRQSKFLFAGFIVTISSHYLLFKVKLTAINFNI